METLPLAGGTMTGDMFEIDLIVWKLGGSDAGMYYDFVV